MRILVVNVNTTESMTEAIRQSAKRCASPGTEVVALTPAWGPEAVEGNFESYLAAVAVMDRVVGYGEPFDAVVQAGFGEHGREGLQELVDVPVVDITEASAHVACLLGTKFSVVTTLDRAVSMIEDRLRLAGLVDRCASVRSTGLSPIELDDDPDATLQALVTEARAAVERDRAEVICLGCAGMAGLEARMASELAVPIVDGVAAAVRMAEALVGLGLTTSKVRTHAAPRPKRLTGWPITPTSGAAGTGS